MDTVDYLSVVLQPYANQSFVLPKDWLRTALPSSILASALEEDPNTTTILIPNTDVTPDVLQLLVDLSQGREPPQHNPNLLLADRYLNIPELLYYADPYYDSIPDRSNGTAPENHEFIGKLLQENRVWPFGYLVLKGYQPTNLDFILATSSEATDIVRILLGDPRIDPASYDNDAIRNAAEYGRIEMVRLLLADPRVDPDARDNEAIKIAASNGHVEVVRLLLADPSVDPAPGDNYAIGRAAENGHVEVVRLLLADPRVNPADEDNEAIKGAAEYDHKDVVALLLADPRVRNSLSPAELTRYQQLSQQ